MDLQPLLDRAHDDLLVLGIAVAELEQVGQHDIGGDQRFARLGACREYGVVVLTKAIGVVHGDLRFADAAQAAYGLRLRKGHRLSLLELRMKSGEQVFTSDEKEITRVGNIPDRRELRMHCASWLK